MNQIFVFIQIAGQGNHHAETQAQGEKYLPQNEDEQFGGNLAEVRLQIESNPFHRARQGNVAHDHGNQEQKQQRHQVFRRFFNTANDAFAQNPSVSRHKQQRIKRDFPRAVFDVFGKEAFR